MSTIRVGTISNAGGTQSTAAENVINGSAKAWVSFNGTGTVAIRAAYNVSSITDNGVGNFRINFTTALLSAEYCIFTGARTQNPQDQSIVADSQVPATTSYAIKTGYGGTLADYAYTFSGVFS